HFLKERSLYKTRGDSECIGVAMLCVVKAPPTTEKIWELLDRISLFRDGRTVGNFDGSIGARLTKVFYFGYQISHYFQ
ncbi:hypothetical protein QPM04_26795, partial [Massilia varians]|uniref:hypothetical protein n=1 Tax=Massilia varians TaxID=457921 RepID=UPI00255460B0